MTDVRGVIPPVPTYLREDGGLDAEAQERGIRRPLDAGADGVVVLGTSGEGPALPPVVRRAAVRITVDAAKGASVVVGCGGQTVEETLGQLEEVADAGATAGLVLPPFYFRLGQAALAQYFEELATSSPIDLLLYHIPGTTKNGFDATTVARLASHPRIVGIKDSGVDFGYHLRLRRQSDGAFAVFQGAAPLLFASAAGGSTDSICPVTALFPSWELEMRGDLAGGDVHRAAALGDRIAALAGVLNLGEVPLPVNFKEVAALLDLGPRRPHEPALAASAEHRARLRSGLAALGIDPAAAGLDPGPGVVDTPPVQDGR